MMQIIIDRDLGSIVEAATEQTNLSCFKSEGFACPDVPTDVLY